MSLMFALALLSECRGQVVAGRAVGQGGVLPCLPFRQQNPGPRWVSRRRGVWGARGETN